MPGIILKGGEKIRRRIRRRISRRESKEEKEYGGGRISHLVHLASSSREKWTGTQRENVKN